MTSWKGLIKVLRFFWLPIMFRIHCSSSSKLTHIQLIILCSRNPTFICTELSHSSLSAAASSGAFAAGKGTGSCHIQDTEVSSPWQQKLRRPLVARSSIVAAPPLLATSAHWKPPSPLTIHANEEAHCSSLFLAGPSGLYACSLCPDACEWDELGAKWVKNTHIDGGDTCQTSPSNHE